MGMMKTAKAESLADDAAKATAAGRRTFAAVLNSPRTRPDMSGGIDDWSQMIDAVEAQGWRLEQWTVGQDGKGRPQAYPVFRR